MFILTINHWIQWAAGSWEKSQKVWLWGGGTDKDLRKIHIVKKTHAYKQSPGPTGTNQCKVYTWIRCTVSCISTREWFIHFPFVAAIWLCNNLTQTRQSISFSCLSFLDTLFHLSCRCYKYMQYAPCFFLAKSKMICCSKRWENHYLKRIWKSSRPRIQNLPLQRINIWATTLNLNLFILSLSSFTKDVMTNGIGVSSRGFQPFPFGSNSYICKLDRS